MSGNRQVTIGGIPNADHVRKSKAAWHAARAALPVREKVRILLEIQRAAYPVLCGRRDLKGWIPWEIEP